MKSPQNLWYRILERFKTKTLSAFLTGVGVSLYISAVVPTSLPRGCGEPNQSGRPGLFAELTNLQLRDSAGLSPASPGLSALPSHPGVKALWLCSYLVVGLIVSGDEWFVKVRLWDMVQGAPILAYGLKVSFHPVWGCLDYSIELNTNEMIIRIAKIANANCEQLSLGRLLVGASFPVVRLF
jgi:hypothetical protein